MHEIIIHEVGLRDGLQIEKEVVPTEKKIEWARGLIDSGVNIIQLGSFVNPTKVPQMADTEKLFEYSTKTSAKKSREITLAGLVLNEKGLERGLSCGVEMFCMGVSASNTHSMKNTGMSTQEAMNRIIAMAKEALKAGRKVQTSVQSAFGCGFEGVISKEHVMTIVKKYLDAGIRTISLADTAGYANPEQIEDLFKSIFSLDSNINGVCHLHNAYGFGLANAYAALKAGVTYFETAFAGLGGCPFTVVTGGNVATEDLVHMFQRMKRCNNIQLEPLLKISKSASEFFKRELCSTTLKTGTVPMISKAK